MSRSVMSEELGGGGRRGGGANVRERRFEVDQNFVGWRLDHFLANRLGRMSRSKAAQISRYGDIAIIPERRVKPGLKLLAGEIVVVREHLTPEQVQDDEVVVLYEDDALLILNKPAGMLVHESTTIRLNTIQAYLERRGDMEAEPVHRLDRETSGALVCAKTKALVAKLRQLFASDHPQKVYRALVLDPDGRWPLGQRETITRPLGLMTGATLSLRMGEGDLACTTHVVARAARWHERFGPMSDLEVRIETGRQHQIRAHLALEGTPIAGDKLYGQTDDFFMAICDTPDDPALLAQLAYARHALHAWRLGMRHPVTGANVRFEAPLPPSLWPEGDAP